MNKKYLSMSNDIKEKIFNEKKDTEYGSLKFLFLRGFKCQRSQRKQRKQ